MPVNANGASVTSGVVFAIGSGASPEMEVSIAHFVGCRSNSTIVVAAS